MNAKTLSTSCNAVKCHLQIYIPNADAQKQFLYVYIKIYKDLDFSVIRR